MSVSRKHACILLIPRVFVNWGQLWSFAQLCEISHFDGCSLLHNRFQDRWFRWITTRQRRAKRSFYLRAIETNGKHMACEFMWLVKNLRGGLNIMAIDTWPKPSPPWLSNKPWSKREDIKILFASKYFVFVTSSAKVDLFSFYVLFPHFRPGDDIPENCFFRMLSYDVLERISCSSFSLGLHNLWKDIIHWRVKSDTDYSQACLRSFILLRA